MKILTFLSLSAFLLLMGCKKEEDSSLTETFKVTIENVFEAKDFFQSGAIDAIPPGGIVSFSFHAGKGHSLKFSSMIAQTNDIFIGPSDLGLKLYDVNGVAKTGDVTNEMILWDAGTEVNEMPGSGPNQAPRQSSANTGQAENGNVTPLALINDGFTYPKIYELLQVSLTHDGGSLFTVTIENTSTITSLTTPFAPGVWVVHSKDQFPLYKMDAKASPGLEKLAEDGNNSMMLMAIGDKSGLMSPYAPGAYSLGEGNDLFNVGSSAGMALERLAEDGDPSGFEMIYNTPEGQSGPGPIFPGGAYSFTFTAEEGDNLSLALMLVQSNDWFMGLDNMPLFSNGIARVGDITSSMTLYDAGTEVDEYAGAGINQPVRQSGGNTGMNENGQIAIEANPSDNVPDVGQMIKVTLELM